MTSAGIIAEKISKRLEEGLVPDGETVYFIKSAYGLDDPCEIASFIEDGGDSGAVIDLLSYPDDGFRMLIERLIPAEGVSPSGLKTIEERLADARYKLCIKYNGINITIPDGDAVLCRKRFLRRLNLDVPFDYLKMSDSAFSSDLYSIRGLLRRQRFFANEECSDFITDLVNRFDPANHGEFDELAELVNISAGFLKDSDQKPYDVLSAKKFFYERAVDESIEFSRMMKTYSMEFMMMKRLQPPLVTLEEARSMLRRIDALTSIVYSMIIPSVIVTHYDGTGEL